MAQTAKSPARRLRVRPAAPAADRFSVSVKGVLEFGGRILLRRNQRGEYELPGGRLEAADPSPERRLAVEFREESGIRVRVLAQREPWLYEVGERSILIVPYACEAVHIPGALTDEDGGTLHWLRAQEAAASRMPQGYKDTIQGEIPHRSASTPAGAYFRIIPNYVEASYFVRVRVRENGAELMNAPLPLHCSPRELIRALLGRMRRSARLAPGPVEVDQARATVTLNYSIAGERPR